MESILARALEYTLKYWLKSFSRDQFKLQGRTVQLSNLDINGDALHASFGLPHALNVSTARVGKLAIMLPSLNTVQTEPILVKVDKFDLVLKKKEESDGSSTTGSSQPPGSSTKGGSYGFAEKASVPDGENTKNLTRVMISLVAIAKADSHKIADGMSIKIATVNLLLETCGSARCEGGASWAPPMASFTMRNLSLYSTNENWQTVNLKEARDFSSNKKFIYVFRKLEWESLSIDLLPHPDMFTDNIANSKEESNKRDGDGAKRVFFGGELFLEGISGEAHITVQRTESNNPLGLEVQLHITEAVCPALSEPGLRALLRFLTGVYVCLNRGDVDPKTQQMSTEAAGRSLVSIIIDHIFLRVKDAEFQLELLMQSLFFSRASVPDGDTTKNLTRVMISGMFLRDTFSHPPCTLVQPSMEATSKAFLRVPDFGNDFCPPIYPLQNKHWNLDEGAPIICFHCIQVNPSPAPPTLSSQTVIDCQPLMIHLQEESCLRIASFLADGIMINPGDILPDHSIKSLVFSLRELVVTVPLGSCSAYSPAGNKKTTTERSFNGARLHIENLFFLESPSVKLKLLNLDKDPACFSFWDGQPVDASQKKWTTGSSQLSLSFETCPSSTESKSSACESSGLWKCVELKDACIEVAMVTADGTILTDVPPPGGIVRVGITCKQYLSNTSVEQLFFVLDLYGYLGKVSDKIAIIGRSSSPKKKRNTSSDEKLMEKVPSDTAATLTVEDLQLRFLESPSMNIVEMPLVEFIGKYLLVKVKYRTLSGAIAASSTLRWENIEVSCVDAEGNLPAENDTNENGVLVSESGCPQLRLVIWVHNKSKHQPNSNALAIPFLDINIDQVIPFNVQDTEFHSLNVSACIFGVRLGGGMNYTEALLHRFGIFGPDGGPGEGLSRGLQRLSDGPLSKLFSASPLIVDVEEDLSPGDQKGDTVLDLAIPDDFHVSIELKDWLFALEGAHEMPEKSSFVSNEDVARGEKCWHTTFRSLRVNAKSSPALAQSRKAKPQGTLQYPVELVTVCVQGLQTLKPQYEEGILQSGSPSYKVKETFEKSGGIDLEARMVTSDDSEEISNLVVENLRFSVKQPIEALVGKTELQHLTFLCKTELESMSRMAVGVLRLLQLDKSISQAAMDQLSNLGYDGLDKLFTNDNLGEGNSTVSTGLSPTNMNNVSSNTKVVGLLEEEIRDSRAKCAALISDASTSESSTHHLADIEQLNQKLESMQNLLTQLQTQI